MCTFILLHRLLGDYPIIALHNRYMDRGTREQPPRELEPGIYCPVDEASGGTWIGLNRHGLLVAVTNQGTAWEENPGRSRGLLIRDLLEDYEDAAGATERLTDPEVRKLYRRGNFAILGADSAWHVIWDRVTEVRELGPGAHVISSLSLIPGIDWTERAERVWAHAEKRRVRALQLLDGFQPKEIDEALEKLMTIAADHGPEKGRGSICYHSDEDVWCQTSSTIIAVAKNLEGSRVYYCEGNPCENEYKDYSEILRK